MTQLERVEAVDCASGQTRVPFLKVGVNYLDYWGATI